MNAMRQIPNILTTLRLILALIFPLLPANAWLPVLLTGAASEFLDGYIARRFSVTTKFGQLFDPIADKAFVFIVSLTFVGSELMSIVDLLMVAIRDIVVTAGVVWVKILGRQRLWQRMKPHFMGKIATAFQIFLLISIAYLWRMETWILYSTIAVSAAAAIAYIRTFSRHVFPRSYDTE